MNAKHIQDRFADAGKGGLRIAGGAVFLVAILFLLGAATADQPFVLYGSLGAALLVLALGMVLPFAGVSRIEKDQIVCWRRRLVFLRQTFCFAPVTGFARAPSRDSESAGPDQWEAFHSRLSVNWRSLALSVLVIVLLAGLSAWIRADVARSARRDRELREEVRQLRQAATSPDVREGARRLSEHRTRQAPRASPAPVSPPRRR